MGVIHCLFYTKELIEGKRKSYDQGAKAAGEIVFDFSKLKL